MAKLANDEEALLEEEEAHAAGRPVAVAVARDVHAPAAAVDSLDAAAAAAPTAEPETAAQRRARLVAAVQQEKEERDRARQAGVVQERSLQQQMASMGRVDAHVEDTREAVPVARIPAPITAASMAAAAPQSTASPSLEAAYADIQLDLRKAHSERSAAEEQLADVEARMEQMSRDLGATQERARADAEEAAKLRADLAAAQRQVEVAANIIGGMQEQVDEATTARDAAEAATARTQGDVTALEQRLAAVHEASAIAEEGHASEAMMLQERCDRLAAEVAQKDAEVVRLKEQLASASAGDDKRVAVLTAQNDALATDLAVAEAAHQDRVQNLQRTAAAALAEATAKAAADAADAAATLADLRAQCDAQTRDLGVAADKLAAAGATQQRLAAVEAELATVKGELAAVGGELTGAMPPPQQQQTPEDSRDDVSQNAAISTLQAEAAALRAQAHAITAELEAAEGELRRRDAELQAAEEHTARLEDALAAAQRRQQNGGDRAHLPAAVDRGGDAAATAMEVDRLAHELTATRELAEDRAALLAARDEEVALVRLQLRTQRDPLAQTPDGGRAGTGGDSSLRSGRGGDGGDHSMLSESQLDSSLREQAEQEAEHNASYRREEDELRRQQELHRVHERHGLSLVPILPPTGGKEGEDVAGHALDATRRQPSRGGGREDPERARLAQELQAARAQSTDLLREVARLQEDVQLLREGADPDSMPERAGTALVVTLKDELDDLHDQFDRLSRAKADVEYALLDT